MAGDQDHVGLGLGDACRDGADAGARHQLHADLGGRVDLLQVIDQLRQILDRIDVVMRRRRDQRDAGRRVAQLGDLHRDLEAGQLSAFAGLGALRDLDLDLAAIDQVFGGDAEPARGDLLDRGIDVVAVRFGLKCVGSSPPSPESDLAPIRFMAMVRVLCASADSAPSDMPGVTKCLRISVMLSTSSIEMLLPVGTKSSRSRMRDRRRLGDHLAVALEGLVGIAGDRRLQRVDRVGRPGVCFAALAVFVEAADR